ncbi:MAG TPA: hypothetical protein VF712_20105 [Thermoleophilaceae bacterium]
MAPSHGRPPAPPLLAGDEETAATAGATIVEERAMAGSVQALFGKALDASLAS